MNQPMPSPEVLAQRYWLTDKGMTATDPTPEDNGETR